MRKRGTRSGGWAVAVMAPLLTVMMLLAGCDSDTAPKAAGSPGPAGGHAVGQPSSSPTRTPTPTPTPQATITVVPSDGATEVRPDEPITVSSSRGTLREVRVTTEDGDTVSGEFNSSRTSWRAEPPLRNDSTYVVKASAVDEHGRPTTVSQRFTTLAPQAILGTDIYPLDGQTVGVGMPIVIKFSAPIADDQRAAIQRRLSVETSRRVEGAWHWFSDSEVHWRPRHYWPANTDVTLRIHTNGAPSGNGAWGIKDKVKRFHIGRSVVTKTNLDTHRTRVYVDGRLARTIPVSAGKPGWETRSGTKVVLERRTDVRMRSSTVGVSNKKDPNYYDVVAQYALRVTWSGEFLHSAPWSVWAQGRSNTSHGCVGMSTDNARWLWNISHVGDPAETTGSSKWMPVTGNGYGDWNLSWSQWKSGSAVH